MAFWVEISWKYFFLIFLWLLMIFFSIMSKIEIIAFFSTINCFHRFFYIFYKTKKNCSHARLEWVFVTVLQPYRWVKSLFRYIISWLGVILKFTVLSLAFGQPSVGATKIWKWSNCPKIYRKFKNHIPLTTNFRLKLRKGWKSKYARGRFLRFSAKKWP